MKKLLEFIFEPIKAFASRNISEKYRISLIVEVFMYMSQRQLLHLLLFTLNIIVRT